MGISRHIGISIGTAVLAAAATVTPVAIADEPPLERTALVLCGTTCPTPDDTYIDIVKNQYIEPTHPGENIAYVPVTAPQQMWPITGFTRLLGLAFGDPRLFAPGGPAWPNEPWWKLSGFFDVTAAQSLRIGAADLDSAIAAHDDDHLVVYGLSQGAGIANVVKKRLAGQYPAGTSAPDIDFVLGGDPNLPNGGLMSRFDGAYIPLLDFPFNGPAVTDTQFDTVEINRQYDGFTDFPLYPLNVIADLNAVMGIVYLHTNSFDVSLPADPTTSPAYQGTHGDTSYYFFQTQDLPLFAPLRSIGVPEKFIDVVEPFFRVIVEAGYDRTIKPWVPTPARLLPSSLNPGQLAADVATAVEEGMNNAKALVNPSPKLAAFRTSPLKAANHAPVVRDSLGSNRRTPDRPGNRNINKPTSRTTAPSSTGNSARSS
ncbi:PE-PPE domain-containing protein [Mycolicibacterium vinylchloridicum]|uniref:PE-PPE domain-containing protein n=1 Tax=Mycolicibacterium vinylchloridicum TaxID=2736928 RepID=UPI001C548BF8|nr:PE-PPE domain-containing protein [Mycolicibacterium vinylchloridicum]